MGFEKLWDPDKVVLIYDHLVPASQQDDTRHFHARAMHLLKNMA